MKALLFALLLLPACALAQTTPRPPDQYCILRVGGVNFSGRAAMDLQSGTGELAASREQVETAACIKELASEVDALNDLSSHGWEVISVARTSSGGTTDGTRYYLRRHQP